MICGDRGDLKCPATATRKMVFLLILESARQKTTSITKVNDLRQSPFLKREKLMDSIPSNQACITYASNLSTGIIDKI